MNRRFCKFVFLLLISLGCWANSPGIQSFIHTSLHKLQGLPCDAGPSSTGHQDCLVQTLLSSILNSNLNFDTDFAAVDFASGAVLNIASQQEILFSLPIEFYSYSRGPPALQA